MKRAQLIRFRIDFSDHSNLGPGKITLLEGIKQFGSLSEAARHMNMSYRRAWLLLDSLNSSFDTPATLNSVGGPGGGGAKITAFGELLIERYRAVEQKLNDIAGRHLDEVRRRVSPKGSQLPSRVPIAKRRREKA